MIGEYETSRTLGTGAFGTVYLASRKNSDVLYAIKSISKQKILRSQMGTQVKKEISIMKGLDHPNIVGIYEVLMSTQFLYIVMEFAPGGELFSKITRTGKLAEVECRRYARHLCSALSYCHSKNVCHRDIKPQNILLDAHDNAVLADFGFASIMEVEEEVKMISSDASDDDEFTGAVDFEGEGDLCGRTMEEDSRRMKAMSTICGTTAYMAPEILKRKKYFGDKADIWSLGVVFFVLLIGFMPFKEQDEEKTSFSIPKFVSREASDFVKQMLVLSPEERATASRLLKHEWISNEGDVVRRVSPVLSFNSDSISSDSTDDGDLSNDFEIACVGIPNGDTILSLAEKCMEKVGWKTRRLAGSMKASSMTSYGLVMVDLTTTSSTLHVRHVNLAKDLHAKVISNLKNLLVTIYTNSKDAPKDA
jgi:serine/threonine protein kinase